MASLLTLQFYANDSHYPYYRGSLASATVNGKSSLPVTSRNVGMSGGTFDLAGEVTDFTGTNYISFRVGNGKLFYAWIMNVTTKSPGVATIHYKVDAYRTYRGNIALGTQFVERASSPVTFKRDTMLQGVAYKQKVLHRHHNIGNSSERTLVVQVHVYDGEQFSNTPINPTPYRFYFLDFNASAWTAESSLVSLMNAITGTAKPENIVTLYSIPRIDVSHLPTGDLVVLPSNISIPGFKALTEGQSMYGRLYTETPILFPDDMDRRILHRVDHTVQVVVPDAGIINIPDHLLDQGELLLRQDVDMFSGASNYMIVDSLGRTYTQSVRGSSIASIPIISDPLETYLSQNQNALMTSLIGDVASLGTGMVRGGMQGGAPGAIAGALPGLNGIVNREVNMADMTGRTGNPPAFLGTALAPMFNQQFWLVVTMDDVTTGEESTVRTKYGYPQNRLMTVGTSGYVKTQGCDATSDGTVPQWAIDEINGLFNGGIYFR